MSKFRKKPAIIEAIQWNGDWDSMEQIEKELNVITLQRSGRQNINWVESWNIKTLEGMHVVSPNDWVIKGIKGECYPCKPDIFEATYKLFN